MQVGSPGHAHVRVLALSRYDRLGASSRIRMFQYEQALAIEGVEVTFSPLLPDSYLMRQYTGQPVNWPELAGAYARRLCALFSARHFDLVWLEKELFPSLPAWFEHLLNSGGVRYVVDFDDAVFHNDLIKPNPFKRLLSRKIDAVMQDAVMTVCGNDYIARRATDAGAHHVRILPSVIDLDRYRVRERHVRDGVVIGWIGSPSTAPYLNLALPALRKLALLHPISLRVIGGQFNAPGLNVECRPWAESTEALEISDFDIGIMPLFDTPWERGKCGYKLIQYMACGRPVVASPIGINKEIVQPGRNGYLASTDAQWLSALETLCSQPEVSQALGAQGRRDVEQRYCIQVTAPRLADIFREALRSCPR